MGLISKISNRTYYHQKIPMDIITSLQIRKWPQTKWNATSDATFSGKFFHSFSRSIYDPFCSFKNHWLDRNTYSTVNQNLLMEGLTNFLTNCKFSLLTFSRNQVLRWFPINHQGEEPFASIRITWTWQLFISTCDKDYTLIEKIWTWNWTLLCQCNGEEKGIMRVYWRICRELNIVIEKQAALNFTSSNQLSLLSIGYCCR